MRRYEISTKTYATAVEDETQVTPYEVRQTSSGWAVVRSDGTYAEFMDPSEADEALEFLQSGDMAETDYEWTTEPLNDFVGFVRTPPTKSS